MVTQRRVRLFLACALTVLSSSAGDQDPLGITDDGITSNTDSFSLYQEENIDIRDTPPQHHSTSDGHQESQTPIDAEARKSKQKVKKKKLKKPKVALIEPHSNDHLGSGEGLTLKATASDNNGGVKEVNFLIRPLGSEEDFQPYEAKVVGTTPEGEYLYEANLLPTDKNTLLTAGDYEVRVQAENVIDKNKYSSSVVFTIDEEVAPTQAPTKKPAPAPVVTKRGLQDGCKDKTKNKFNICLDLESLNGRDKSWMRAFGAAKAKWESVITGSDNKSFTMNGVDRDFVATKRPSFRIQDLYIAGVEKDIDGRGGVLGSAGPKYGRKINGVKIKTTVGFMQFDSADISRLMSRGTWESVILHEMGHVLGIGTLWEANGFHSGKTKSDKYTGRKAKKQWRELGCSGNLPVETDGGSGTAGGHFDEECLDGELMTGVSENSQKMKLSKMTVGALEDLGYEVDYDAADDYTLKDLAKCNYKNGPDYCPEHRNSDPSGRMLRSSTPRRRKLSAAGREAAEEEAVKQLVKQRQEKETLAPNIFDTDGEELIFLGGDVITVYIEEADGTIFGETIRWDDVKNRSTDNP